MLETRGILPRVPGPKSTDHVSHVMGRLSCRQCEQAASYALPDLALLSPACIHRRYSAVKLAEIKLWSSEVIF